jgi:uncharacterized membrane protein
MATAGFILGLMSVIGAPCCIPSVIAAPLGLIFSIIALNQISKQPGQRGKGLAIAGLILSLVGFMELATFFGLRSFPRLRGMHRWI